MERPESEEPGSSIPDNNKLFPIANLKQLLRVRWDISSPRFKAACFKLGVDPQTELTIKHLFP